MAHASPHGAPHGDEGVKLNHEPTDIPLAGTTRAAIVTMAVILAIMALVYGAWGVFDWRARKADQPRPAMAEKDYGQRLPPLPRVQSLPVSDLAAFRAAQAKKLNGYGWVDKNTGVVRIPIDRAIEVLAGRAATIADPAAASAAPAAPAAPDAAAPPPAAPATSAPGGH